MSNIFIELSREATERELTGEEISTLNELLQKHPTLDRTLGVQYRAIGPKKLQLALEVTEDHLQPWGVTNGGVYASLGETAGSMASFVAAGAGPAVVGTSNQTHFLRPSVKGDVIVSTAEAEHIGRTTHLFRIEHINEKTGKCCALTFLKTQVVPDMPKA
ncbi:PaaI family thioesterase [Corynebacterium sp. 22_2729]|uniref:PaaI family thioesterase n=1 Tax=Corynebacterium macclintockiae TaxID=2913501 RepID=UPI0025CF6D05|nr:PaaI family thioesterase [uncultured Corynebacterium sp.]